MGAGSSPNLAETAPNDVCSADLLALVCVSEAGRQEIVAQVGGGLGVGILPASGETLGGAPGLGAVEGESVEILLTAGLCEPCR